jgi:hypothetical protein
MLSAIGGFISPADPFCTGFSGFEAIVTDCEVEGLSVTKTFRRSLSLTYNSMDMRHLAPAHRPSTIVMRNEIEFRPADFARLSRSS